MMSASTQETIAQQLAASICGAAEQLLHGEPHPGNVLTTWRRDPGDQLPNGRQLATEWLSQIRAAQGRKGLDTHG